eukprot:scaffold1590_cov417-Prasinococcus_capsulatus_cf.AAC.6
MRTTVGQIQPSEAHDAAACASYVLLRQQQPRYSRIGALYCLAGCRLRVHLARLPQHSATRCEEQSCKA